MIFLEFIIQWFLDVEEWAGFDEFSSGIFVALMLTSGFQFLLWAIASLLLGLPAAMPAITWLMPLGAAGLLAYQMRSAK